MDYNLAGVSVVLLVVGIVEAAKRLGIDGKGSFVLALCLGFVFGMLFYVFDAGLIPEPAGVWIRGIVFGISFGLAGTGLYDLGTRNDKG